MSKTSYLLVIIFAFIVLCFLGAAFLYPQKNSLPTFSAQQKEVSQVAQSTISLSPAVLTLIPGQSSFVDIFVANENSSPETIQLEIGYDPYTITPIAVIPGKYFTEQTVLLNTINPRNSRITLAITCTNKPSPCGSDQSQSVARISFTVNPVAVKKETTISVLPKTLVASSQNPEIILKTANAKISLRGIQVPQASPSAVIQLQ